MFVVISRLSNSSFFFVQTNVHNNEVKKAWSGDFIFPFRQMPETTLLLLQAIFNIEKQDWTLFSTTLPGQARAIHRIFLEGLCILGQLNAWNQPLNGLFHRPVMNCRVAHKHNQPSHSTSPGVPGHYHLCPHVQLMPSHKLECHANVTKHHLGDVLR